MTSQIRLSELIPPAFRALHADIRAERHSEYMLRGGRGSGKSSFVSLQIVLGLLRHPDRSAIVYRKVASTLRESAYEQILWAFHALGARAECEPRLMPLEIRLPSTGQRILFRGADDPGKSKSIKLARGHFGYLWFEEAAEFSGMDDILTIKASILRGGRGITFYSYNPPVTMRSWINAEAMRPRDDRAVHFSDYRMVPREWLGDSFLDEAERLRASNERLWRHVYLGEVTGTGGQVFDNLVLREITGSEIASMERFVNGLDFGFAVDPDAFVRGVLDERRGILLLTDEFTGLRVPVDQLGDAVRRRAGREVVRCDSADPRVIAQLRERGVTAVAVRKGAGSVRAGIRFLQELKQIVIDPARCPRAAKEFAGYEYARDGSGGFLSQCPDRDNHTIDAVRYALEEYIGRKRAGTVKKEWLGMG